jgi:hypothetical protein
MRTLLTISLLCSFAFGQGLTVNKGAKFNKGSVLTPGIRAISGCSGPPSVTGSSGCLLRETFEGSTLCYASYGSTCDQGVFFAAGTPNFAYTTPPAPLQQTRSFYVATGGSVNVEEQVTAQSTFYAGIMVNVDTLPASSEFLFSVLDGSDNLLCRLSFFSNNQFNVSNTGGTTQTTAVTLATNTTYYIAIKAVAGTGANATCTPYFSSNGSSWTTGTASTNGTWTANVARVNFLSQTGTDFIVDDIRIATSLFTYW